MPNPTNDLEVFKLIKNSPIEFIKLAWRLTPERDNEKFVKGKNITWQQHDILLAVESAIKGGKNRISVRSGHGIGKSTVLSWIILWYLFCYKDAQIPCTAPTSDQMHDVLWKEVSKWLQKMPPVMKDKYEWSSNYIRIVESPETWFARAKTARKENPEALAGVHGEHVLFLIDEASGVPEEIFNTAEGALTDKSSIVVMISNATRLIGYFYDSHHKDKEHWNTLAFNSEESPIVDQEFTDRIISKHGKDSDEYAIRVKGQFPKEEMMDEQGYVPLYTENDLNITDDDGFIGDVKMGIDPAGEGNDKTIWIGRDNFKARVLATERISDSKSIAQKTLTLMSYFNIQAENITVDNFGTGANVAQEMGLSGVRVNAVNVGDQPNIDKELYVNLRAYAYWKQREWIKQGGQLVRHTGWEEATSIRHRKELNGKMKIMGKVEMKKKGYHSPDHMDALMLTFVEPEFITYNLPTNY
jgi:hypothetical protein